MSNELRIALVAEGQTDRVVIAAAVEALLGAKPFVLRQIHPEESVAFGPLGTGWVGVYRWCRQAVQRSGRLSDDIVFKEFQILVVHLDADVADKTYADGAIAGAPADLPCALPCPPSSDTTNALRAVLLGWAGELNPSRCVVLCTPSKSTEAWVVAALYPAEPNVIDGSLECVPQPANILQAKPAAERLVRANKKMLLRYQQRKSQFTEQWNLVRNTCTEAERFSVEFLAAS